MSQLSQWISATVSVVLLSVTVLLVVYTLQVRKETNTAQGFAFFFCLLPIKNFYLALLKVSHQQRLIFFTTYTTYEEEEIKI